MQWHNLLAFAVLKMGLNPDEFWRLTFAEFWPTYNLLTGKTIKPLSRQELDDLEETWINGPNN